MKSRDAWMDIKIGIERETHRLSLEGEISRLPQASQLQPPLFTKDFAESQLEIVTRPHTSISALNNELDEFTAQARKAVSPEILWPFSMPPLLPPDSEIDIAHLGPDKKGQEGELYRRGLALRYGKPRQMICGVHVNISIGNNLETFIENTSPMLPHELADSRSSDARYLRLARNLHADLPYLVLITGASPLLGGMNPDARRAAISYRNSKHGYARAEFRPYLDLVSLERYIAGIRRGLATESAKFRALGLMTNGVQQQLNSRVFQQEKEFYAPVRLKRTAREGESGLDALEREGVEYLELRFLDVDPFSPRGISEETLIVLHLFVLDALMTPSGGGTTDELKSHLEATEEVALIDPSSFFEPGLDGNKNTLPLARTRKRLEALMPLARQLDADRDPRYVPTLEKQIARTIDPSRLPSSRFLRAFEDSGSSWTEFGMNTARILTKGEQHAMDYAGV